jgi:group I intron endonuclease
MDFQYNASGIYAIVNKESQRVYLGQTRNLRKRILEHQRLLELNKHPNPHLQHAFNKYGRDSFSYEVVVLCDDPNDLDEFEAPFLNGTCTYDLMPTYNIAMSPTAVMTGRKHSDATKEIMSRNRRGKRGHVTEIYREKLRDSHIARFANDPDFMRDVAEIVRLKDECGLTFNKISRLLGLEAHSPKRKYKYKEFLKNG